MSTALQGRVVGALGPALERQRDLRLELERAAAADLEAVGDGGGGAGGARARWPLTAFGSQLVGARVKLGRSRLTRRSRTSSGMPGEDPRQRVGDGGDLGGFGVDLQGDAVDDDAEVEGPGDGGDDRDQGERGAFVGAGEVDLAGGVDRGGAGAGAGGGGADLGGGRAGGRGRPRARPGRGLRGRSPGRSPPPGSRGRRRAWPRSPVGVVVVRPANSPVPSARVRRRLKGL